jgi:hypothetical protein
MWCQTMCSEGLKGTIDVHTCCSIAKLAGRGNNQMCMKVLYSEDYTNMKSSELQRFLDIVLNVVLQVVPLFNNLWGFLKET